MQHHSLPEVESTRFGVVLPWPHYVRCRCSLCESSHRCTSCHWSSSTGPEYMDYAMSWHRYFSSTTEMCEQHLFTLRLQIQGKTILWAMRCGDYFHALLWTFLQVDRASTVCVINQCFQSKLNWLECWFKLNMLQMIPLHKGNLLFVVDINMKSRTFIANHNSNTTWTLPRQ